MSVNLAPGAGRGFWLESVLAEPGASFAAAVGTVAAVVFPPVLSYPQPGS